MAYKLDAFHGNQAKLLTGDRRQRIATLAGMLRDRLEFEGQMDRPSTALSVTANLVVLLADEILAEQEDRKD